MYVKKPILIKNKTVNDNAVILSLLFLLFSIITLVVIAKSIDLTDDEIGELFPVALCVSAVGIFFIFYKLRKINYLLDNEGDTLILRNAKTNQILDKELIKNAKIEYGYYNYRYRTLINTQVPIISFQFPAIKPFRCSYKSTKVIWFWNGDDTQKEIYNVPVNLEQPNYNIDGYSFDQLAKMLVPNHKLAKVEIRPM